jgi:ubiquinone/menaquinone biosynthesis C-methylase UbiE
MNRTSADEAPPDPRRTPGEYASKYFETRLAPHTSRTRVWQHICRHLQKWIPREAEVLELGAGFCDFSNNVAAGRVVAMDIDGIVTQYADTGVTAVVGDCTDLRRFDDDSFDVVFASNLLEHLERADASRLLSEARRVLRRGGRIVLVQPNFRLKPGAYFDDFTHVAIYTDRSLPDYLVSEGWAIDCVEARFLPLTMKSRASGLTFLVPWYLKSPVKPFAGQMLVVASVA